ncbi:hypothetical protein I4U23_011094 [Adineta vaga]|nr:hypothetical protein I4U23_011094 [Adineta vaga]
MSFLHTVFNMDFLSTAWDWVCSIAKSIWTWLTPLWDWVKAKVEEKWEELRNRSTPFRELFSLKLLVKRIKAKYDELRNKLSSSDQKELDDLVNGIDSR